MSDDRFITGISQPNTQGDQEPRSPTRRRLLALLATAPIPVTADTLISSTADTAHDPIPRLFLQFEEIVAAH